MQCIDISRSLPLAPPHLDFIQQALHGLVLGELHLPLLERLGDVRRDEDELGALFGRGRHDCFFFLSFFPEAKKSEEWREFFFFFLSTSRLLLALSLFHAIPIFSPFF